MLNPKKYAGLHENGAKYFKMAIQNGGYPIFPNSPLKPTKRGNVAGIAMCILILYNNAIRS